MSDISSTTAIVIVLAVVALILIFRRKIFGQSGPMSDSDAQRFAKLLVAEIKLYNEQRLESAQRAGNIYQELKPDIDRAKKMYDGRIASTVGFAKDYFHEELVRNLAGGDASKLGPGYDKRETVH